MRRSRRAVLAACGAGLTVFAGCSTLNIGGDDPVFEPTQLKNLGDQEIPAPPAVFPVSIPDAMIRRHRDRARALVERVPTDPDIPNEAVVKQLRHDRETVLDRLGDVPDDPADDQLDRLQHARYLRAEAAAVEAAYRAATNTISQEAVADRRAAVRSELFTFERDWTYRGDHPAAAVVVHHALEDLRRDVRQAITPERAFPADPPRAVFRAGEVVQDIEAGRAALTDAEQLRTRYLGELTTHRAYRIAISVVGGQLQRFRRQRRPDLHAYINPRGGALPFERSIEDTPLERLYREAAASVTRYGENARDARLRGEPATVVMATGKELVAVRTLDAVVTAIRNGSTNEPATVDEIAAVQREAVDALEVAWAASPRVIAVELTQPAYYRLRRGMRDLSGREFYDDEMPDATDAHRAFVNFTLAAQNATAIPPTVAVLQRTLSGKTA